MDHVSIMFYHINPRDYSLFMQCPRSTEQPGAIIMESRVMQGIRCVVPMGYLLSILYFYGFHRPRLPFAQRSLSRLHYYFFPSAGYSTPLGIFTGIAYACYYDGYVGCSAENVACEAGRERERALVALQQREMEEAAAAAKRRGSWLDVFTKFSKPPASQRVLSYEDFLDPNGILDVGRQAREVHDHSYYQHYSKQQVDALVSAAMKLRYSPEEERWLRTAGRLSGYGILGMILIWNKGGMFFRLFMGLGFGVVSAAVISFTKLDTL